MKSSGFTLVEVLVSLGITVMVVAKVSLYQNRIISQIKYLSHTQSKLQILNNYQEYSILVGE